MRFSIVLAIVIVTAFLVVYIRSTLGDNAVIVFGLFGFWGVLAFFKHVMNT